MRLSWVPLLFPLVLSFLVSTSVNAEGRDVSMDTLAATFVVDKNDVHTETYDGASIQSGTSNQVWVSKPYSSGWEFIAVGATWEQENPPDSTPVLEVRVSHDGNQWSAWTELHMKDDMADHGTTNGTNLLFVRGRYVQLRAALYDADGNASPWEEVQLTVIDGRKGPESKELVQVASTASSGPQVISRREWGANESYRYDKNGQEIWPRRFYEMKAFFIHHTATSPSYPDPAVAVRSIYYYHAVSLGWGDIGYHYVIDQYGNIYEGRYQSERNGLVAAGGHALGYNESTMGISIIGNYSDTAPSSSSIEALTNFVAHRAMRYNINPQAPAWLPGTRSSRHPGRWFDHSVNGHRDTHNPPRTSCPGSAFFARLPEIRENAVKGMDPPVVQLASPDSDALLNGMTTLQANASSNTARVEYRLVDEYNEESGGSIIAVRRDPPWEVQIDSRSLPASSAGENYRLRVVAMTGAGISAYDERTVRVAISEDKDIRAQEESDAEMGTSPSGSHETYLPILSRGGDCVDLARNGTFRTNTDWILLRGHYAARYSSEKAWTGQHSLRIGMPPGDSYPSWSSARLKLNVPAAMHQVVLRLRYLPQTDNPTSGDRQYLGLLDDQERYIQSILPPGNRHEQEWQALEFDLSKYIGQTIYLYAGVQTTTEGTSSRLYIDDVEVEACK